MDIDLLDTIQTRSPRFEPFRGAFFAWLKLGRESAGSDGQRDPSKSVPLLTGTCQPHVDPDCNGSRALEVWKPFGSDSFAGNAILRRRVLKCCFGDLCLRLSL